MIDLTKTTRPSPLVQTVAIDPGTSWTSASISVDAPPDSDSDPAPDAIWPTSAKRTGVCGAVSPRIVALPGGRFRMYYTQILPRAGHPAGANDYDNATSRILSATSIDGLAWLPERGVRLSADDGGAGEFRVASAEVVPAYDADNQLRMYFESTDGPQSKQNAIRSAVSQDGLVWRVEPNVKFELVDRNLSSPRIVFLDDGRCRLYCGARGIGIISAVSSDGGRSFDLEPGVRLAPGLAFDRQTAFAPEIMRLANGSYRMYYAGYGDAHQASVLTATSDDGLKWRKWDQQVLAPGSTPWDAAKCSEMCVLYHPGQPTEREHFRMHYEACDGTARNQRGVWRIASAVCRP